MPLYIEQPTLITLEIDVAPGQEAAFIDWQAEFNARIVVFPGFVSLEFLSPSEMQKGWLVVQRFATPEAAAAWHQSEQFELLKEKLHSITSPGGMRENFSTASSLRTGVTEVIVAQVNPDNERAYRTWSAKIHQAEARFAGFRGVYVQAPSNNQGHWITLLQFDTIEHLDQWLQSPDRQKLLSESAPLISSIESHRMISPYSGWFASIAKVASLPPVWKQSMLVLLVLFPIVMLEIKYLSPLTASWPLAVGTFIGNALSIALISFPMMPIAIYFLGWWLLPEKGKRRMKTICGTVLLFALYLAEILLFWK